MGTDLRRAERKILRAIEIAKRTNRWPLIERDVSAFLSTSPGADKFKAASDLSARLFEFEDSGVLCEKSFRAFRKLRVSLEPFARLSWSWYQKGETQPGCWYYLLDFFRS